MRFHWFAAALAALASVAPSIAEDGFDRFEIAGQAGSAVFMDESYLPHAALGGGMKFRLAERLGVGAEFLYLRRSSFDQEYLFVPQLTVDFRNPDRQVVPFALAGVGVMDSTARGQSQPTRTILVGTGVRVSLGGKTFLSPQLRLGRVGEEIYWIPTVAFGFTF